VVVRTITEECVECELCGEERRVKSTEGRDFRKIPRGSRSHEGIQMDVCGECYEVLKQYFIDVIKEGED
jgi:NAD-dependent dihydropyrimidine dehydrogenase PreA subunit